MLASIAIGLFSAVVTSLIAEVYCHRALSHRAFQVNPVLASGLELYFRVTGGTDPQSWAAIHRIHHRYADTPLDPHSPRQVHPLAVLFGMPVLFSRARQRLPEDLAPHLDRSHLVIRVMLFGVFFVLFGLVQVSVMVVVHFVVYMGIMGSVNAAGHLVGRKPHPEHPGFDLAWLAIPLLGHGYHNSHHAHPTAARTGFLDPIWPFLRLLDALRLIDLGDRTHVPHRTCCAATISVPIL